ncbi:MAG: hypothetical protein AB7P23_08565 [Amphiplicatus sp.]
MNDKQDREDGDSGDGDRLRLGLAETPEPALSAPAGERRMRPKGSDRRIGPDRRGGRWRAASRQTMLVTRLMAVFFFFAVLVGWPGGNFLAHLYRTGSGAGWSYFDSLGLETFLLAIFVPVLTILIGYIVSRQQQMMAAAEDIASAAKQFIHPDQHAAENAMSVGAAVRGQMDALNVGLDGALTRLATVEAMIRQHVAAIETASESVETRAAGAVSRVSAERARLIELTEHLNSQADAFAAAIAEKAQASIEALHSAGDFTDRAESHLEERLARLDSAAQLALRSFEALSDALAAADESVRASTEQIDASTIENRAAMERATRASEAAAEAAARNAANVGAAAARASQEARKAAEDAIETSSQEAERASRAAYEAAEREARRIAETTHGVIDNVKRSANEMLNAVATDAGKATSAASQMSEAARLSADAAAHASANIVKASVDAKKNAEAALSMAEKTTARMDERNKALASARAALEQENARLESLIDEQRKRADRLADAIASQTERLSKLAESQLREQEASVRLAEAQLALQKKADEAARAAQEQEGAARARAEEKRAPVTEPAAETAKPAPKPAQEEPVLNLNKPAGKERERPQNAAREEAPQKKPARRREPPLTLGKENERPAETAKRDKQAVSWREILDATDDAEPLDLAAVSAKEPDPAGDGAATAIKIISELQNFTFDLETRLYGDPPLSLRERFDHGDRNVFANRLLRLNETDVKRRIRMESGRDKAFERDIHDFLQGFERLLEDATTSETADEDLEEYLSSPLGRVYLLIGATVGYFA